MVEAHAHALLDDVLEVDDAEHLAVARDGERRAALAGDPVELGLQLRRRLAALGGDVLRDRVARALSQAIAVQVHAAHARLGAEGDEGGAGVEVALADPVLLGEHDDRAALGRLVRERGHLRGLHQLVLGNPRHRHELGGLPVAERERAGLVEQQHVDVAGGLDRAPGQGEHVAAHEPVHAGDADRRQQRADRRRDQRDEQGDQRGDRCVRVRELGERPQRHDRGEEHDREAGEQDVERDLVRRLAALGALDERDHAVEEALARLLRDLDHDPVRQHARAARDRRAVAAGLADHGCRLARDGGLVDRRDALDHGAVAGDHLAGRDDDDVAADELRGGDLLAVGAMRDRLGAHRAQARGLGLSAALGQRLGQICEDDREPQPQRHGEREPGRLVAAAERRAAEHLDQPATRRDERADLDHEHHRVAELDAGVELAQRCDQRRPQDLAVEQGA